MRRLVALVVSSLLVALPAVAEPPRPTPEQIYAPRFLELGMRDLGALVACYDSRRAEAEAAFRRVRSVSVRVTPEGRLARVGTSPPSAVPPELRSCFLSVVSAWTVPPPPNGRELRLRFTRRHFF